MRIIDENGIEITEYDLTKGHLISDKIISVHHDAVPGVKEVSHYEKTAEYKNGGVDVKKVIDTAYVAPVEAYDEYEEVQRYILYTEEEIAKNLKNAKEEKTKYMDEISTQAIYNGIDVKTSVGIEHFDLTEKDQINITNINSMVGSGKTLLYHSSGNLCRVFSDEEIVAISTSAINFVTYNTTLINHIHTWINQCENIEDVYAVTYGTENMPEEIKNHLNEILEIK